MTTLFEQDLYIRFLLPPTATEDDIKKAFRKFAIMAHPDKGGDIEIMQILNEAYEVLGNPAERIRYDQYREKKEKARKKEELARKKEEVAKERERERQKKEAERFRHEMEDLLNNKNNTDFQNYHSVFYITPTGKCYHTNQTCHGLRTDNVIVLPQNNILKNNTNGLRPCKLCTLDKKSKQYTS